MGGDWKRYRIEELKADSPASIAIGPFGSRMKSNMYVASGIPVIRGNNISDTKEFVDNFVYITPEFADQLKSQNVTEGDLVFPHRGNIGTVGIVGKKQSRYVLSTSLMKLTCNKALVDPLYLFYFFRSPAGHHSLMEHASTVGTPGIGTPLTSLRSIEVSLPSFSDQQAIACILGALDDKIELNRRMNRTLEAMARTIFKSWFVDFDPVRAKAAGRQPPGLKPEIAELFPDSFEDSELGEIPKGWAVKRIGEVAEFAYGKALKASDRKPGNVPVFGSNGQVGMHNESLVKGPGIIIGRKGNPGIVKWSYEDFFPIDTTFYVKKTGVIPSLNYLFYALKSQDLPSLSADSAVPGLNRNLAYMSKLIVPNENVLLLFDAQTDPLFQKTNANEKQSKILAALRDTLLPKLISGGFRVPDAEKIAGRGIL